MSSMLLVLRRELNDASQQTRLRLHLRLRLAVEPANPRDAKQRWFLKDMSAQAKDEEGRPMVALVMPRPTPGLGYYAISSASSSPLQQLDDGDFITEVKKKSGVHQEFLDESVLFTLLYDDAVSPSPCLARPTSKIIPAVIPSNNNPAAAAWLINAAHGAVALSWQPCSAAAHGGTHCLKLIPWWYIAARVPSAPPVRTDAAAADAEHHHQPLLSLSLGRQAQLTPTPPAPLPVPAAAAAGSS